MGRFHSLALILLITALLSIVFIKRGLYSGGRRERRLCALMDKSYLAFPESYSLWMEPDDLRLSQLLQREIDIQATVYSSPRFKPHVTLLPDIKRPIEEVIEVTKNLAKMKKSDAWQASFDRITRGSHFFQCTFILMRKAENVMQWSDVARQAFGMENTLGPYMPHLSLVYADMTEEEKDAAVAASNLRIQALLSEEKGFSSNSISIWYTPTEDKTLETWCKVTEIEISTGNEVSKSKSQFY